MSLYIPRSAVEREFIQQIKRKSFGLKTGEYVKYPDAKLGPYVIKASLAKELNAKKDKITLDPGTYEIKAESKHETD